MKGLFFWKNWVGGSRRLFFFLVCISIISLFLTVFWGIKGNYNLLNWNTLSQFDSINLTLEKGVEIPQILVLQKYLPSSLQWNEWGLVFCFGILLIGLALLVATASVLEQKYQLGILTVYIFWLNSLRIDYWFPSINQYVFVLFILGITLAGILYFIFIRPELTINIRFYVQFSLLFLFFGIIFSLKIPFKEGIFHSLASGIVPIAFLSGIFIFWVSFENCRGILWMVMKSRSSKSMLNFCLISFIYLLNLGFIILQNTKRIPELGISISPFWFLLSSSLLGFWGIRLPYLQHQNTLKSVFFSHLYLGLFLICISSISFSFLLANDALIEFFEDCILYSHFIFGLVWVIYGLINFKSVFSQGLNVHKIIYKPPFLPLIYTKFIGSFLAILFLWSNNFFPFYQLISSYYSSLGDVSYYQRKYRFAETYYHEALRYEYQNHKTNYALATLALEQQAYPAAALYFKNALLKQPSAFAYVSLVNLLEGNNEIFEALFEAKAGLKIVPKSGELYNQLGLLYLKTKALDSAYIYFRESEQMAQKPEVPATNQLYIQKKLGILPNIKLKYEHTPFQVNALATGYNEKMKFPSDSFLTQHSYSYLVNYSLKNLSDSTISTWIRAILPKNSDFQWELSRLLAFSEYYGKDKIEGFLGLRALMTDSLSQEKLQPVFQIWLEKEQKNRDYSTCKTPLECQKKISKNPLSLSLLSSAISVFNTYKQEKKAYEYLLRIKTLLPDSPDIQKLYILQCFKIFMPQYAAEGMLTLQKMIPTNEYKTFRNQYLAASALYEKAQW